MSKSERSFGSFWCICLSDDLVVKKFLPCAKTAGTTLESNGIIITNIITAMTTAAPSPNQPTLHFSELCCYFNIAYGESPIAPPLVIRLIA